MSSNRRLQTLASCWSAPSSHAATIPVPSASASAVDEVPDVHYSSSAALDGTTLLHAKTEDNGHLLTVHQLAFVSPSSSELIAPGRIALHPLSLPALAPTFSLPAQLAAHPLLVKQSNGVVRCFLLLATGSIILLSFESPAELAQLAASATEDVLDDETEKEWVTEYESVFPNPEEVRDVVDWWTVDDRTVAIEMSDGSLTAIECLENGDFAETSLKHPAAGGGGGFSIRSLLPFSKSSSNLASLGSSRNLSALATPESLEADALTVALAGYSAGGSTSYVFGLSGTQRLRIWTLSSSGDRNGACIKTVDLLAGDRQQGRWITSHGPNLRVVKNVAGGEYVAYLAIFLPGTGDEEEGGDGEVIAYGLLSAHDSRSGKGEGDIKDLVEVARFGGPTIGSTPSRLVGFELALSEQGWTAWAAFDQDGETVVCSRLVTELSASNDDASLGWSVARRPPGRDERTWGVEYFEELLAAREEAEQDAEYEDAAIDVEDADDDDEQSVVSDGATTVLGDLSRVTGRSRRASLAPTTVEGTTQRRKAKVAAVFLDHLGYPGRFSTEILEDCLRDYARGRGRSVGFEDSFERTWDEDDFLAEEGTLMERLARTVGRDVALEFSRDTGKPLFNELEQQVKLEWFKLIFLANSLARGAGVPDGLLVLDGSKVVVTTRGKIEVVREMDESEALRSVGRLSEEQQGERWFEQLSAGEVEGTYLHLAPIGLRHDLVLLSGCLALFGLGGVDSPSSVATRPFLARLERALFDRVDGPGGAVPAEDVGEFFERLGEDIWSPFVHELDRASEEYGYDIDDEDRYGKGRETVLRVRDALKALLSPEASFQALWSLLTTTDVIQGGVEELDHRLGLTTTATALLVDGLRGIITSRYEALRALAVLLVIIHNDTAFEVVSGQVEQGVSTLLPRLNEISSAVLASFHDAACLVRVATVSLADNEQLGFVVGAGEVGLEERMRGMSVAVAGGEPLRPEEGSSVLVPSLLDALALDDYRPSVSMSSGPFTHGLTAAVASTLAALSLTSPKKMVIDTPSEVKFLHQLVDRYGLYQEALDLAEAYARSAGVSYVLGHAYLGVGRWEESRAAFLKAASGVYGDYVRLDEDTGLTRILPSSVGSSLARYYAHVASLYGAFSADVGVAEFAGLCISAVEEQGEEGLVEELSVKLFKAAASLKRYEDAYDALMAMPSSVGEGRNACLAHLISILAEDGHVALLTRLPFVGLEADLERNLAFRARNSDPFASANPTGGSGPNYYRILYAFYTAKGDHRSAGSIMYQHGRRLAEVAAKLGDSHDAPSFAEVATLQCHSFLAALNSLSLVEEKHAWIVVSSDSQRPAKRQKIQYRIPATELSQGAKNVDVVEKDDIRREYFAVLARLQLASEFPELQRTNIELEPDGIVTLFTRCGLFDAAFHASTVLDVDLSSTFEAVTDRCMQLTLQPSSFDQEVIDWVQVDEEALAWEGSLALKAWRLLDRHLDRHDGEVGHRYRSVVLERVLATNPATGGVTLPKAVCEHLLASDPDYLIRTMMNYDRLQDAFTFGVASIAAAAPPLTATPGPATRSLPYDLFDQLLAMSAADSPALGKAELAAHQAQLRSALDGRVAGLKATSKNMGQRLVGR